MTKKYSAIKGFFLVMHDISHFLLADRTTNVMVMERRLIRKSLSQVEEKWYSVLFMFLGIQFAC